MPSRFFLAYLIPGDPARTIAGPHATVATLDAIRRQLGLERPLYTQFGLYALHAVEGNLGTSIEFPTPVLSLLWQRFPATLMLTAAALVFELLFGVPLGVMSAVYRNTVWDRLSDWAVLAGMAAPTFWVAIIVLVIFAIDLNMFPSGGISDPTAPQNIGNWASHVTLPVFTLVIVSVAGWSRFMRTSMIDSLVQDYVRTARAKGLSEFAVVFKHALRNSVLPLITLFGYNIPTLIGGALFVEVVFNYPGMGLLTYNAAIKRDYPIVMGAVLLTGLLTIAGNLMADVLYGVFDPRIRYD